MSFDKEYENRKDRRRKYYGAKAVCRSCRNHGSCDYCEGNRLYKRRKAELNIKELKNETE